MKLTVTRQAPVQDVLPGEGVILDGKHWIVDEIRRTRDGAQLLCATGGTPPASSRRKTFEVKADETVTLEPSREDGIQIVAIIAQMLADTVAISIHPGDSHLAFEVTTVNDTKDRTWKVVISA